MFEVVLHYYDLSQGIAAQMSQQLVGKYFEGIWHTGIVVYNKEYYYGGGISYDFSTLRPQGAPVRGVGADASGSLSFMDAWDAMCRTIMSAGSRRGTMMAMLRYDHPDIEAFIDTKRDPARQRMFNLSVLVTDAFMRAVNEDADWPLHFEARTHGAVRARDLWQKIMRATYDYAEPGVVFIDRINARNNLHYCEPSRRQTPAASNRCRPTSLAIWAPSIWRGF